MTPPTPFSTSNPGPMCYWDPSPPANVCEAPSEPLVCLAEEKPVDTYLPPSLMTATAKVTQRAFSLTSVLQNLSAALQNFGCQRHSPQAPTLPTAEIPITDPMGEALLDFFEKSWPRYYDKLLNKLHLKEYLDRRDLVFERDPAKDGIIHVKNEYGTQLLKFDEIGILTNLEIYTQENFCPQNKTLIIGSVVHGDGTPGGVQSIEFPPDPSPPCHDPMRLIITALYGESELSAVRLDESERQLAKDLRDAMGLGPLE